MKMEKAKYNQVSNLECKGNSAQRGETGQYNNNNNNNNNNNSNNNVIINNNIYLLQLGRHPMAVVILHVNET